MAKRSKESKLFSSPEVLESLLQKGRSPISDQFLRWKLWRMWKEIVGPEVGLRTRPVHFERGTLFLWVESGVWLQQISFITPQLKKKINDFMGREWVLSIRLTLDQRSVPSLEDANPSMKDYLADG